MIVAGIFFTILSLAALALGILDTAIFGYIKIGSDAIGFLFGILAFALFGFIAHKFVQSYLRNGGKRALGITFIVLSFLQYWLLQIIVLFFLTILNFLLMALGRNKIKMPSSSIQQTVYTIHDGPFTRKLVEYDRYGGYRYYHDENGNTWKSGDEGKTFFREN